MAILSIQLSERIMDKILSLSWLAYSLLFFGLCFLVYFRSRIFGLASRVIPDQQAYNNVVMASCALVTLVWGAYTFDALQQRDKAAAELEELQKRLRDTESTLLNVSVGVASGGDGFYLTPTVTIKNVGTEALYFRLCKDSLSVSQLSYSAAGQLKAVNAWNPQFYLTISGEKNIPSRPIYDMRVPTTSERSISYFVPVKAEGIYYVTFSAFSAPQSSNDKEYGNATCNFKGGTPVASDDKVNGKDSIWFSSAYVVVKNSK